MGIPVVVATAGGLPVVDATATGLGIPMTVASNGYGTPVTIAANGLGIPAVFSPPLGPIPTITLAPLISDTTPTVDEPLTCSQGTWANSPTSYTYQWYHWVADVGGVPTGTAIPGANSAGYTPVE